MNVDEPAKVAVRAANPAFVAPNVDEPANVADWLDSAPLTPENALEPANAAVLDSIEPDGGEIGKVNSAGIAKVIDCTDGGERMTVCGSGMATVTDWVNMKP